MERFTGTTYARGELAAMMPEQQQRILGYFIEEAKDHLNTIEQGLLNLQATIEDSEMVNELFRAAHSVKGGAAMLSLNSIQRASHRLEDYFKVLKETSHIQIDRPLESMLLQVFDGLQALLEELQGPFGLTDEKSQEVMTDLEPVFEQLESHLNTLAAQAGSGEGSVVPKVTPPLATPRSLQKSSPSREDSALKLVFSSDVPGHLREMLALFKQADTPSSRTALEEVCQAMQRIGEQFDLNRWCDLTTAAQQAVGNPAQTYRFIAPIVIKDLKKAQEQVLSGQADNIHISTELEALLPVLPEPDVGMDEIDAFLDEAFAASEQEELDLADLFEAETTTATVATDLAALEVAEPKTIAPHMLESAMAAEPSPGLGGTDGAIAREPAVGAAELNSLADLFEGEVSGLGSPWDEITESEAAIADSIASDPDLSDDFADLLSGATAETATLSDETEFANLFGEADLEGTRDSDSNDFDQLFTSADTAPTETESAAADTELDTLLSSIEDTSDEAISGLDLLDETGDPNVASSEEAVQSLAVESALDDFEDLFQTDNDLALANEDLPEAMAEDLDLDLESALTEGTESLETDVGLDLGFDEVTEADLLDGGTVDAGFAAEAIEDPWSGEEESLEVSEASALDALDELWSESHPNETVGEDGVSTSESTNAFSEFASLDLEDGGLDLGDPELEALPDTLDPLADFNEIDLAAAIAVTETPDDVAIGVSETDDFNALFGEEAPEGAEVREDLGEIADNDFDTLFDAALNTDVTISEPPVIDPDHDTTGLDDAWDLGMDDSGLADLEMGIDLDVAPIADTPDMMAASNLDFSDLGLADSLDLEQSATLDLDFLDEASGDTSRDAEVEANFLDALGFDEAPFVSQSPEDSTAEEFPLTESGLTDGEDDGLSDLETVDAIAAESTDFAFEVMTPLSQEENELSASLLDTPDTFIQPEEEISAPPTLDLFEAESTGDRQTDTPIPAGEEAEDFFASSALPDPQANSSDDLFELGSNPTDGGQLEATGDAIDDFFKTPAIAEAPDDDSSQDDVFGLDQTLQGSNPSDLLDFTASLADLDIPPVDDAVASDELDLFGADPDEISLTDLSAEDSTVGVSDDAPFLMENLINAEDTTFDRLGVENDLGLTVSEPTLDPDLDLGMAELDALTPNATLETGNFGVADPADIGFDLDDLALADLGADNLGTADLGISEAQFDADIHDLDDLDALLDEEEITPPAWDRDITDIPHEESFDDLDALLGEEEPTPVTEAQATLPAAGINFDDLEALLEDNTDAHAAIAAEADEDTNAFDDLEALLDDTPIGRTDIPQSATATDDFGDLEKLLEEADQTLGGSSPVRGTGGGRPNRRMGGMVDQTMRVSVKHLDNLNNLVGELVVNRNSLEQDQERLRQFLDNLLFQVQQLNDVGQRMRDLYERSLLESSLLASRQAFHSGGLTRSEHFGSNGGSHATGATFDALEMDRFTGFHTLTQEMIELIVRVRESASDIAYTVESTDQIARQFRQVTTQLQEGLNKARMVPFAQTADRLPRAVRDISIKCGKEARLVVEGRDTLIDKMILERLYDPMTHLVNNAITHGVETPEERAAMGKPREGTITVRAFYQGNQTVIYIADDGAGINPDVVKRKAIQKGMITQAEADAMTTLETYELLFRHGFSTRDKADDFAGRGVGMDVVQTALAEIRGSITIDSELGKGTSFTIRLPLTLSISKALSCLNNQARIAFPMDGVEDMFDVPKERIQTDANNHTCIQWRDTLLTFQPLSELLQFNRLMGRGRVYGGNQDEDMISIVVLRNANTFIGVQVDRVLGEQEIVIKQIEGPVPKPMGIAGATVLGDGRVMPIGDVLELIDIAQGRVRRESGSSLWSQVDLPPEVPTSAIKTEPTVLIVDDSITVRELLSMSFNKVGYRVEQARDGQEAWEKLRSGLPCDLVFCDIEMPRMDGLELLSRMQKDGVLKRIPIAMLTSRGADRHRQMAVDLGASGYFTKPYLEEALLDAAQRMLNGEVLLTREEVEADMEA